LDGPIPHAKAIKICCQTASKGMPSTPHNFSLKQLRFNVLLEEGIRGKGHGFVPVIPGLKDKPSLRVALSGAKG
jgi:hypothetical protein